MPKGDRPIYGSICSKAKNNQVSVNSMQSTNLTRSAPPASLTTGDQAVSAAQPAPAAEKTTASASRKDDSTAGFANELAQVADNQQPLTPAELNAPAQPASEADAEQWLLHILEQQSAQLQARDAEQGSAEDTLQAIHAAIQALPTTLPGQEQLGAEQAASDQPLLSPSAEDLTAEQLDAEQLAVEKLTTEKLAEALTSSAKTNEQLAGDATGRIADQGLRSAFDNGRSAVDQTLRDAELARSAQLKQTSTMAAVNVNEARPERVKIDPALLDIDSANQPLITQLERLVAGASATSSDLGTRIDSSLTNPVVTESATLERTLKLQGPETKWGEQLLQALRDNVELQMQQQRVQNTTIRLDPPELGSMEITLTHELGRLNVQISAQHSDVVRLLQQTSDRLRHELVAQNFTHVDVEISGGQNGQQQSQRDQARLFSEESVLANQQQADNSTADHLASEQQKSVQHSDVLVTV
jgi:flagellar hook-length control protein FliK